MGFQQTARELYDLLLKPAQADLQGKISVVIVPDAELWNLPFQALQSAPNRYAVEDFAISYAPSLTVLREMANSRRRRKQSDSASPGAFGLLALGNPALGKEIVKRVEVAYRDENLAPLPEAETEVKTLGQLYGAGASKVFFGAGASEEEIKRDAGKYKIIHLATHGILDNANPMYSHVVLAQPEGKTNEDGLLEAWEMMNLDLKAEMVVLSACETTRGRVGAGEGVIGMSWALFVAGVPTTVVSQWKVDAASTTDLMLEFHRNVKASRQNPKASNAKAEALRQASLKLLKSRNYQHPFYWAGFVVIGDAT